MQVSAKGNGTAGPGLQPELKRSKSEKVDQAAQEALPKAPAAAVPISKKAVCKLSSSSNKPLLSAAQFPIAPPGKPATTEEEILRNMRLPGGYDPYLFARLASLLAERGEIDRAERNYKIAYKMQDQNDLYTRSHYARFLHMQKRHDEAEGLYQCAMAHEGAAKDFFVLSRYAVFLKERGALDEARKLSAKAVSLKRGAKDYFALVCHAEILFSLKEYKEAAFFFKQALLTPTPAEQDKQSLFKKFRKVVHEYIQQLIDANELEHADATVVWSLDHPALEHPDLLNLRAKVLRLLKRDEEALACEKKVYGSQIEQLCVKALALKKEGKLTEAATTCKTALHLPSGISDYFALKSYAEIALAHENYKSAARFGLQFILLFEADGHEVLPIFISGMHGYVQMLLNQGDVETAEKFLTKALAIKSLAEHPEILRDQAKVLRKKGKTFEGIDLEQKANRLEDPLGKKKRKVEITGSAK